jgi:hypothetical protein
MDGHLQPVSTGICTYWGLLSVNFGGDQIQKASVE